MLRTKRKTGNLLGLAVLSYLSRTPMHPYDLSRTLRTHDDRRSIKYTHSTLYMVVRQLNDAGFIRPHEPERVGNRPERTVYTVTEAGRHELSAWLRDLIAVPQHEYPHFVAALAFVGMLPPEEVVSLLRARHELLTRMRDDLRVHIDQATLQGTHPLFLVEEEYRLTLLNAELGFVHQFSDRITRPGDGWADAWTASLRHAAEAAERQDP